MERAEISRDGNDICLKGLNTPSRCRARRRGLMEEQAMLMCSLCCLPPCEPAAHNINDDDVKTNTES